MIYKEISFEKFQQAEIEALKNSQDFLYESELLYKIGSFGHSKSLSILGIEELGKSIGYGLLARYKFFTGRIQFDPQVLLDQLQKNHLTKQSISITLSALINLNSNQLSEIKTSIDKGDFKLSFDKKNKEFFNYKSLKEEQKFFKKWESEFLSISELDKSKQKGLYVEINEDLKVNIPKMNKAIESRKSIKTLKRLLSKQINLL